MSAAPAEDQKPAQDAAGEAVEALKAQARHPATRGAAKRGSKARRSGETAANEEAAKSADEVTAPVEDKVLDVERDEWDKAPGFKRMPIAWEGEGAAQMQRILGVVDRKVLETFPEAYAIMSDLFDVVRIPEGNPGTGEVMKDALGFTIWKRNPLTGAYLEDWTLLTVRQKEDFLFRITTQLFEWEQRAANLWTEAMFAKGIFTERFAIEFDAPMAGTIEDRTARGNAEAAEARYFALLNAALSRKADALVRSMTNLQMRLKDTLG